MPISSAVTSWAARRVLVTGAGGFIGSHLVEALVRDGATVRAMVRYNGRSDPGMLGELPTDIQTSVEIVHSDITDGGQVRRHVGGQDVVFHLAALIAIPYSYVAPASYVATNVGGTLNVLEAVRDTGVSRLIQTSTSEVYGTARYTPIDENHPLNAQSPYSASKIGSDSLALSFHRSYSTPVAVVRPFNTYGPRQSARAIVPTIVSQLLYGDGDLMLGDLRPVRDLTYVADTVAGLMAAAASDECLGVVTNLGTGVGVSIGDLAETARTIAGRPNARIRNDPQRMRPPASEVMELIADARLAASRCAWRPTTSLSQGLAHVVEYIRAHPDRYDARAYTT